MRRLGYVMFLVLAVASAFAEKTLVNVDEAGIALKGYDPVAYFTDNAPMKGQPQFSSRYKGATYYFASAEHKKTFDTNPAKYEPQFGGFCAYGVSKGYTVKIEPDAFQVVDGRLLLQYDKSVREKFRQDTPGNLKRADSNWPTILDKQGK
jgi:YHS domain-containing protein